jgi:hypothetical protein
VFNVSLRGLFRRSRLGGSGKTTLRTVSVGSGTWGNLCQESALIPTRGVDVTRVHFPVICHLG